VLQLIGVGGQTRFTIAPSSSLTPSVRTTGGQTYNDAVTLQQNTVVASTANGDIRFSSTVDGSFDLTVNTGGTTTFVGEDPIFPSVHRLGACIGIPIMAGAAGIADIWRQRSGVGQDLSLDLRAAQRYRCLYNGCRGN